MTKLVLENEFGTYAVEVRRDELTLPELVEELLRPVLRAAGYHDDNINQQTGQVNDRNNRKETT